MKTIQIKIDSGKQGPAPQAPQNMNAVLPVALWRGEPVNIDVALFADASTVATVTDVTEIKIDISPDAAHTTPEFTDTATVANSQLDLSVTSGDWTAGTARHARFPLAKGDIAPDMDGAEVRSMWLRLTMLDDAEWVVLCNGPISVYEAGAWPV